MANLHVANLSGAVGLPVIQSIPEFRRLLAESALADNGQRLDMHTWHSDCGTTHCLAGWIVTIHPRGKEIESRFDTPTAASLILHACEVSPGDHPDFYSWTNDQAIEWLKTGLEGSSESSPR